MTVRELLDCLENVNRDAVILVPGYEGFWDTPGSCRCGVVVKVDRPWYYGEYEERADGEGAVLLGESRE